MTTNRREHFPHEAEMGVDQRVSIAGLTRDAHALVHPDQHSWKHGTIVPFVCGL